jgi:hypothetical protein
MKTAKAIAAAISLTILAGLAGLLTSPSAFAAMPPLAVIVTNTPLPVQGTVNATQSGTWNVGITGTPNVNVSNTPSVNVVNTSNAPVLQRDVDTGTLSHVGQKASNLVTLTTGSLVFGSLGYFRILGDGSQVPNFAIPNGLALAVTDADFECVIPNSAGVTVALQFLAGVVPMFRIFARIDNIGVAFASEHLTTPFVVTSVGQITPSFQGGCGNSYSVVLHGYLLPNI